MTRRRIPCTLSSRVIGPSSHSGSLGRVLPLGKIGPKALSFVHGNCQHYYESGHTRPQSRPGTMGRIKVLSIDGGGIRGIIVAAILEALRAQIGRELHEVFDLISGTAAGGIIGLGIDTAAKSGRPYCPAELIDLYPSQGASILTKC